MQAIRVTIAAVILAGSVAAFAAWVTLRPGAGTGDETPAAPSARAAADPERAQRELELLQEKLAAAIKNKRNPSAVLEEGRALVARHPDLPAAHVTLAQVLSVSGLHDEAYTHYARALEIDPRQPEVHDLAASLAMTRQRYDEAQRHYAEAAALAPRNPKYRLHLAVAQLRADRYDEARSNLLRVIQLDSTSHAAYGVLADLYAEQNKIEPALNAINRALELVLDQEAFRESYLRKKAALLRRGNRPGEAIAVLRQLPPKRWVEPGIIDEFAQTYVMLDRPEKAAEHYEAVLPIDPLADWAAERAAHYYLRAGEKERARAALASLRRINPRAPQIPELEAAMR